MRKFWIAFMISALVPAFAMAQPQGGQHMGQGKGPGIGMMQDLNLDSGQIGKMRKLRSDMRRKMIKNRSDMDLARLDFHEELLQEKPDQSKLNELVNKIAEIDALLARNRLETQVGMMRILTSGQKQKMMERMGASMMGGRGMHMGKGENRGHMGGGGSQSGGPGY